MTRNRKIAVTGGIGSGKSAVCAILKKKGFSVFSCDEISRELWGEPLYRAGIAALFPQLGRENLQREAASLVFSDSTARARLDEYAHPRIMERLFARMEGLPLAFAEVPLLFEGGFERLFDGVIVVLRGQEARIASVCARDRLTEEEALARIRSQYDYAALPDGCLTVTNDGDLAALALEIDGILEILQAKG